MCFISSHLYVWQKLTAYRIHETNHKHIVRTKAQELYTEWNEQKIRNEKYKVNTGKRQSQKNPLNQMNQ
jgi:hypothetical protein